MGESTCVEPRFLPPMMQCREIDMRCDVLLTNIIIRIDVYRVLFIADKCSILPAWSIQLAGIISIINSNDIPLPKRCRHSTDPINSIEIYFCSEPFRELCTQFCKVILQWF